MSFEKAGGTDEGLALMRELPEIFDQATALAMEDGGDLIFAEAQKTVPVDRAYLQKSGYVVKKKKMIIIGYRSPYAGHVHYGTKPHVITPKTKKVLRFESDRPGRLAKGGKLSSSSFVFTRRVMHPGTKGQPWLANAIKKHKGDLTKLFMKHFRRLMLG